MPSEVKAKVDNINRRGWLLWALTFAVLFALTAAVPLLYLPVMEMLGAEGEAEGLVQPYNAVVGLSGLVLLFCLYTALKQRQLNGMRVALINEEQESDDVRTRLSELSALFQMSTSLNLHLRLDVHREMLSLFAEHVGAVIDRAETMERMGSRSRQLEQDVRKLAEMNNMKDLFLSTASHELKTPLTSVIAYAELLDDNEGRLNNDQRGEFLRRLRGEAERLLSLIEDILDLTRLESGKLTLKRARVSLNEVVETAVETSRSMAKKHRVELRGEFEPNLPVVPVDEVKMRQVVVNLVVDAIKF